LQSSSCLMFSFTACLSTQHPVVLELANNPTHENRWT
jgi:hypothetical protein